MTNTLNMQAVDEVLLAAIKESASAAFETMVFMPVKFGELIESDADGPLGSISGTIGIAGSISLTAETISGSVSIIFGQSGAEKVFRSMMMMGEDDPVDTEELQDAVGELANMVAGGAKTKLQDRGVDFAIGLPTIAVGEDHRIVVPNGAVSFTVPLEAAGETIYVSASFRLRKTE